MFGVFLVVLLSFQFIISIPICNCNFYFLWSMTLSMWANVKKNRRWVFRCSWSCVFVHTPCHNTYSIYIYIYGHVSHIEISIILNCNFHFQLWSLHYCIVIFFIHWITQSKKKNWQTNRIVIHIGKLLNGFKRKYERP